MTLTTALHQAQNDMINWQHCVRSSELVSAAPFFDMYHDTLLEIGGGDGYLASLLATQFKTLRSIDVDTSKALYYDVLKFSIEYPPFVAKSFEVVFSCHVLAHIQYKNVAMREIRRVLTDDGVAVHIVPSPWWSILTNLVHATKVHRLLAGYVVRKVKGKPTDSLKSILLHPLGTAPSFLHEIFQFSKPSWKKFMTQRQFTCEIHDGPMLQSGYRVFPFKFIGLRKRLAKIFPSSYILVTKKVSHGR